MKTIPELMLYAAKGRRRIIEVDYASSEGHVGGALSSIDIICAIYHGAMTENDIYIQSKGHCAEALFVVLAQKGLISDEVLDSYCQTGSPLFGHPTNNVPGVLVNTGALGHGLSIGVGVCIGKKRDEKPDKCFVLLGDGEMAEGSNYEAMAAAAHYKLDNLVAIIDRNALQISGGTEDVLALGDMPAKARAFGWAVKEIDGHDMGQIMNALTAEPVSGKPMMVIAGTVKGKGVSYMEGEAYWHHGVMKEDQYLQALKEVDSVIIKLEKEAKAE
jgi:transketolase